MPHLQIAPDLELHYLDQNPTGKFPVLLLHGLGAAGASWEMQFPALIKGGFRILAPDMRGFGQSSYPGRMGIPLMAADCAKLLEQLSIPCAHVAGISMGGTVALQLALDFPTQVNRLVLVNTFSQLKPERPDVWLYFIWRMLLVHTLGLKAQGKAVAKRIFPYPEQEMLRQKLLAQITQANPRAYRAVMRAFARFDVQERLGEIRCPTLVMTGELDSTVPEKNQKQMAAGIPGARHCTFPDAGHALIADQPEAFNAALLGFLGG